MTKNPHQRSKDDGERTREFLYLERTIVTAASPLTEGDPPRHHVLVRSEFYDKDIQAQIGATTTGDAHIPPPDTRVLVGYRAEGKPVVLATLYAEGDDVPLYDVGERVIGHALTDSNVRIKPDGTVLVTTDGGLTVKITDSTVTINGGSTGVIRDLTTTKDADGHVTDITLDRSNTVFIP